MPLSLDDLRAHAEILTEQKEHIEKELSAVNYLIEGMLQRSGSKQVKGAQHKYSTGTLSSDVRKALDEYGNSEFETSTIAEILIEKGIRKQDERESLRNSTYLILRDLLNRGLYTRRNEGDDKNPKWKYKKIGNARIAKN
jgi:hypothetical protein